MEKANDWLAVNLKSPGVDLGDLYDSGVTPDNTSLKSRDAYVNSTAIKEQFTNPNTGKFDDTAFNKFYDAVVEGYNLFQKNKPDNFFNSPSDTWIASPYSKGREKNMVKLSTLTGNPFVQLQTNQGSVFGGAAFGKWSKPTQSVAELAQQQKVLDHKTGEELEYTPEDMSLLGAVTFQNDPLVLATYDTDMFKDGKLVHKKGELKLDKNGMPRYETLGDRNPQGRQVLSAWDTLTREGSTLNKFDFFDSDDIEKSVPGIIAKSIAQIAPAFIPYVGQAYVASIIGKNLAEVGVIGIQSINSWLTGKDQKFGNEFLGKLNTLSSGMSEYGRSSFWNFESIANLVTDSVLQLKTQRFIVEAPLQLATMKYKAGLGGSLETIKALGARQGLEGVKLKKYIDNFAIGANASNYEAIAKTASWVSTAYMASTSATEVYNNAVTTGLKSKDAGALYLGLTLALVPLFRADVGQMALKGIGLDETDKLIRGVLKSEFSKGSAIFEAAENAAKAVARETTETVAGNVASNKNFIIRGFEIGKKALNKVYNTDSQFNKLTSNSGKAAFIAGLAQGAYSEGVEETTEFIIQKALEYTYNGLNELGFTATETGVKYNYTVEQLGQELIATAVGGALGGAVFKGMDGKRTPLELTLTDAINAGYGDRLIEELYKLKDQGKVPGSSELSFKLYEDSDGKTVDGVFQPVSMGAVSQQDFIVEKVKDTINLIQTILDSNGILNHSKVINSKNELIHNITDLNIDSSIYVSLREITNEIVAANLELNKLSTEESIDSSAYKAAKKRLDEAKKEYARLTSDESTDEFLREALFNMNGKATSYISGLSKDELTKKLIPEFNTYASLVLNSETNPSLKSKIAEVDAAYEDFLKSPEFRKKSREVRRALEDFTVATPDGQRELEKYAKVLETLASEDLLQLTSHVDPTNLGEANQNNISAEIKALSEKLGLNLGKENFLQVFPKVAKLLQISEKIGYLPEYLKKNALEGVKNTKKFLGNSLVDVYTKFPSYLEAVQSTDPDAFLVGSPEFHFMLSDIAVTEGSPASFVKALFDLAGGDTSKIDEIKAVMERAGYKDHYTEGTDPYIMSIPLSDVITMFTDGGTDYTTLSTTGAFSYSPRVKITELDEDGYDIGTTIKQLKQGDDLVLITSENVAKTGSYFQGLTSENFLKTADEAIAAIEKVGVLATPFDNLLGGVNSYISAQEDLIATEGADNYVNTSQDFLDNLNDNINNVKQLLGAIVAIGEINPIINAFRDSNPDKLPKDLKHQRFLTIPNNNLSYPVLFLEVKNTLARLQYLKDLNTFNANNTTKKLKKESALYIKLHSKEFIELYNDLNNIKEDLSDENKVILEEFITELIPEIDTLMDISNVNLDDISDEKTVEFFVKLTELEGKLFKVVGSLFNLADDDTKKTIFNKLMPESIDIDNSHVKNNLEDEVLTLNNKSLYRFRLLTTDPVVMYKQLNGTPDKAVGLEPEELLPKLWDSPYAPFQSQTEAVIMGYVLLNTTPEIWQLFTEKMYQDVQGATKRMNKTLTITAPAGAGKTTAVLGGIINSITDSENKIMVVAPEKTQAKVIYDSVVNVLNISPESLNQEASLTVDELMAMIHVSALKALNKLIIVDNSGNIVPEENRVEYMMSNFEKFTELIDEAVENFLTSEDTKNQIIALLGDVNVLVIDEATHVPAHILYFINSVLKAVNPNASMILSGDELQMGASINGVRFNLERIFSPKTTRLTTSVRSKFDLVAEGLSEIQMISEKLASLSHSEIASYTFPSINLTYDEEAQVGFKFTQLVNEGDKAALINILNPLIEKLRETKDASLLYITDSNKISSITNLLKSEYSDVFDKIIIQTPETTVFETADVVTPKSAQSMQASFVVIDSTPEIDEKSAYKNRRIAEFYNTMMTRVKNAGVIINRDNHLINFINSPTRSANEVLKFTPESIQAFKELEIAKLLPIVSVDTNPVAEPVSASKPTVSTTPAKPSTEAERKSLKIDEGIDELNTFYGVTQADSSDTNIKVLKDLVESLEKYSHLLNKNEQKLLNKVKDFLNTVSNTTLNPLPDKLVKFDPNKEHTITELNELLNFSESLNSLDYSPEDNLTLAQIKTAIKLKIKKVITAERSKRSVDSQLAKLRDSTLSMTPGTVIGITRSLLNNKEYLTEDELVLVNEKAAWANKNKNNVLDIEDKNTLMAKSVKVKEAIEKFKDSKINQKELFKKFDKALEELEKTISNIKDFLSTTKLEDNEVLDLKDSLVNLEEVLKDYKDLFKNEIAFYDAYALKTTYNPEQLMALKSALNTLNFTNETKSYFSGQIELALNRKLAKLEKANRKSNRRVTAEALANMSLNTGTDSTTPNPKVRSNFYKNELTADEKRNLEDTLSKVFPSKNWIYSYNVLRAQFSKLPTNETLITASELDNAELVFYSEDQPDGSIDNKVKAVFTKDGVVVEIPLGFSSSPNFRTFSDSLNVKYEKVKHLITTTPQNLTMGDSYTYTLENAAERLFSNAYTIENLTLTINPKELDTLPEDLRNLLIGNQQNEDRSISNGAMFSLMVYNSTLSEAHKKGDVSTSDLFLIWLKLSQANKGKANPDGTYKTETFNINGVEYKVREFEVQPVIYTSPKISITDFMNLIKGTDSNGKPNRSFLFGEDANSKIVSESVINHITTLISATIKALKAKNDPLVNTEGSNLIEGLNVPQGNLADKLLLLSDRIKKLKSKTLKANLFVNEFFNGDELVEFIDNLIKASDSLDLVDSDNNPISKAGQVFISIPYLAQKGQQSDFINEVDTVRVRKIQSKTEKGLTISLGNYQKAGISFIHSGYKLVDVLNSVLTPKPPTPPVETDTERKAREERERLAREAEEKRKKEQAEKKAKLQQAKAKWDNLGVDPSGLSENRILRISEPKIEAHAKKIIESFMLFLNSVNFQKSRDFIIEISTDGVASLDIHKDDVIALYKHLGISDEVANAAMQEIINGTLGTGSQIYFLQKALLDSADQLTNEDKVIYEGELIIPGNPEKNKDSLKRLFNTEYIGDDSLINEDTITTVYKDSGRLIGEINDSDLQDYLKQLSDNGEVIFNYDGVNLTIKPEVIDNYKKPNDLKESINQFMETQKSKGYTIDNEILNVITSEDDFNVFKELLRSQLSTAVDELHTINPGIEKSTIEKNLVADVKIGKTGEFITVFTPNKTLIDIINSQPRPFSFTLTSIQKIDSAMQNTPQEYQELANLLATEVTAVDFNPESFDTLVNNIPLEALNSPEFLNFVDIITDYAITKCK